MSDSEQGWVGRAVPRLEDAALLTGQARFIDDLAPVPGLCQVALLRSPHPHARIRAIDTSAARAIEGIAGIVTGADLADRLAPLGAVVRIDAPYFPIAIDRVRHVGEPVALIAAESRYIAEDAADIIAVDYAPLASAGDIATALPDGAPPVHDGPASNRTSNRASSRTFRYGDPEAAFADADAVVDLAWRYPRQSATPIETLGAIAHFEAAPDRFTIWSNFQGPFILQPLMARALGIDGRRLRLISAPHSGGSFGIKQALFPYLVLLAAASRHLRRPLKWIEDRLEHLTASSASAERADRLEAAFAADGTLRALRWHNRVNLGAYVRAPEPASVYRMHAAANGAYGVRDIAIVNDLVLSHTPPVGLNRGYGGPQFYFGLERAMDAAARRLEIDPAEIRRRNFIPADRFPYRAPAGAVYDAGDYARCLDRALELADYPGLRRRRVAARGAGHLFGIGFAAGVEPAGSNMAYVTLAQSPEERARGGGRSGATASATVAIDPGGGVSVRLDSYPAGQGHGTVAAQIVADRLGLDPQDIQVETALDTGLGDWSIAAGNYGNRFASVVVGAIAQSADRIAGRLKRIAGELLEVAAEDVELAAGQARIVGVPARALPLARVAASAHWHPAGLPDGLAPGLHDTSLVSPPLLGAPDEDERIASALTFGFLCDLAAVSIARETGRITIETYVSVHDVGRVLNPIVVAGQVHGGFAHGFGAALPEDLRFDAEGHFLSGSFADYLVPTAADLPALTVGHIETLSPHNALGSKGMGDGSSMLTPAALANALADALGQDEIELPLHLETVWRMAGALP